MTAIPVTDADHELLTRMMTGRPHTEHDWPVVWEQDALQAIARARAEGAASEGELCAEAVEAVASRFRSAHDPVSENAADECYMAIRARGEGGAK